MGEADTGGGETIECRRCVAHAPIGTQRLVPKIVHQNEQDVGAVAPRLGDNTGQHQARQARHPAPSDHVPRSIGHVAPHVYAPGGTRQPASAHAAPSAVSALADFHPGIAAWFRDRFPAPTDVQERSWPRIAAGEHLVITAPTGSGKTLTAFLWGLNTFALGTSTPGATRVLYISPLKALNNDIRRNLTEPLGQLKAVFLARGETFPSLRAQTRSGDTEQGERQRMLRRPPEILITTPESLTLLLTTVRGRQALSTVETVILDEIHSIVENRRGVMLMTGLERLVEVAGEVQRVALSATVRPLETVARYVGGVDARGRPRPVGVIESSAEKHIELAVRFPEAARVAAENGQKIWDPLSDSFKDVIDSNRSTLFFTNSRRMAEKITLKLNDDAVAPLAYAHHGSLAREIRTEVERRLKDGELKAIVATNSLEMGIDIGDLDQVVLVQSPPSVASALQRVGRAGHRVGDTSRGLLFPTHAHDFLEAAVVSNAMAARDIEPLRPMENALDALVQVIVSTVASETWRADDLYALVRRAAPYAALPREQFDLVVEMLAGRYAGVRVRDLQPRIVLDRLQNTLKARKGAVFALYNAGGTIPDRGYFRLRHADSGAAIGELDEEFVWEATVGQTFTLGTQNWRIHRITHNDVLVQSAPPTATAPPFWRAENINRGFHFAQRIGEFLAFADERLATRRTREVEEHLRTRLGFDATSAEELIDFLQRQRAVTERDLPHHRHVLVEHVRSGPGGYTGPDREQQVVLHTSWGGAVNRPIALALEAAWRERFDAEAEIHADNYAIAIQIKDDVDPGIFLSLVTPANFEGLLRRALEGSGFFGARFRECAGRALLLTRQRFNRRMPLWLTRLQAKKLMTAVSKLDDFPVLLETWRTCLRDEFDMPAAAQVLADLESGRIAWSLATVSVPSPFASAITFNQIGRYMYADDRPERQGRTALSDDLIRRAVHDDTLRPRIDAAVVTEFEAKLHRTAEGYAPREAEELAEWVKERVLIPAEEFAVLLRVSGLERPAVVRPLAHRGLAWFVHAENAAHVERTLLEWDVASQTGDTRDAPALFAEFARFYGPLTLREWEERFPLAGDALAEVLRALVDEDAFVEGPLLAGDDARRFCDTENLEVLIRFQRAANRPQFEPRPVGLLPDFLAAWHRVGAEASENHLLDAVDRLRGFGAPLSFWLEEAWHARLPGFEPELLTTACANHGLTWRGAGRELVTFGFEDEIDGLASVDEHVPDLARLFADPAARYTFVQLLDAAGQDAEAFNARFWDAVWGGRVAADDPGPLRIARERRFRLGPGGGTERRRVRARARQAATGWPGNWFLVPPVETPQDALSQLEAAKDRCRVLLDRYGIVCRELANREGGAFRWAAVFGALRVMELAGEVLAGLFFEDLSGPQFALPVALRQLERLDTARSTFLVAATDPIAPTGLGLDWEGLPQRRQGSYLGLHAGVLAFAAENQGKRLRFALDPEDPALDALLGQFVAMPRSNRRWVIQTVNEVPTKESPYLPTLERNLRLVRDHRGVYVERRV